MRFKHTLARLGESRKLVENIKTTIPLSSCWLYAAYFFFPALNFAHLARCAAAIFLRADADIVRFGFGARPFAFAQRARCARLIRLRADAEKECFGLVELLPPPNLPRMERAAST